MSENHSRPPADGPDSAQSESILAFADRLRAAGEEQEEVQETWEKWVVFRVANRQLALPVTHVREILRVPELTGVPNAPRTVSGVTNLRGHVVPIVDTHSLLGLARSMVTSASRLLVFLLDGRAVGLVVDEVSGLENLQVELFVAPAEDDSTSRWARAFYPREAEEPITLLEPARLFAGEDLAFNSSETSHV